MLFYKKIIKYFEGVNQQLFFLLGTILAIIFTCAQILVMDSPNKSEYLGIVLTVSAMLVSVQVLSITIEKKESAVTNSVNDSEKRIDKMLSDAARSVEMLADASRDIRVYEDTNDGLRYCIKSAKRANKILNTVLHNGEKFISMPIYQEWLEAKKEFLSRNENSLKEIITCHFNADDAPRVFADMYHLNNGYSFRFVDDISFPLQQFTIFEYAKEKELIFGWQLPDCEDGQCFKTSNKEIVEFFEKYFWYCYDNKTQVDPSIVIPMVKDKCYDSMRPGVWLYLLYNNPDQELNKVYGIIKITDTGDLNIKNKYKANAKVWYYGEKKKRGEWHSINFEYVPLTQKLHIQYDIIIENPSIEEAKRGINEYTGYLHFEIYEDIHKVLTGYFKDLAQNDKKGYIKLKAYLDESGECILPDIKDEDMPNAFMKSFGVDINNSNMYNVE